MMPQMKMIMQKAITIIHNCCHLCVAQYKCLMEFLSGETPDTQGQDVQACALAKGGVSD
jgi:hypothetical protein